MTTESCAQIRHWLTTSADLPATPPPALSAHVGACPHCRGALAALFAHLLPAPTEVAVCDDYFADLPAFVELERAEGSVAAARSYPALWWHLWTCPDCADGVANLAMLLDAEAEGLIAPPPAVAAPRPLLTLPPLRLARELLHALFAPQQVLGAAWNGADDRIFLAEKSLPGHRLVIHVRQDNLEQCSLDIAVEPPVFGQIVVRFAETVFRAPLVEGKHARLSDIPIELLASRAGPDMLLSIERGGASERDAPS